ncbi:hypothetical protein ACPV55_29480, partial [Vibrio mediterranei]
NQQPATSNQQPATSNQQPATSNQQPDYGTSKKHHNSSAGYEISIHLCGSPKYVLASAMIFSSSEPITPKHGLFNRRQT